MKPDASTADQVRQDTSDRIDAHIDDNGDDDLLAIACSGIDLLKKDKVCEKAIRESCPGQVAK